MEQDQIDEKLLTEAIVRLNGNVLGIVMGILVALSIFIATNWLVIKGGEVVGPHLALLGQYFVGYTVTFVGSLIGMGWGFVTGYLIGRLLGFFYNVVIDIKGRL